MYNHNRDKSHFEAKVVEIEKLPEKNPGICFATSNLTTSEDGKKLLKQRWLWI